MHFVLLFSFWILLGNAQECDPCAFSFPDYAVCTGEDVCPLHAQFVETRCYVKNITTLVLIKQLRIRGNCGSVKQFVYFCQNIPIKDIVMLDSEENHRCKDPTATTEMTTVYTSSAQPSVQRHSNPTIQPTSNHNISTNTSADPHGVTTALPTDINSSPDLAINSSTLQSITTDVDDSSSPPTRISNHHSSDTFHFTTQSINVSKIFTNITNNTISSTRINPNRYSEQTPSTEDATDNPTPDASTASARGNGRTTSSVYIYNEKIRDAYNMGIAALTLVVLVVLGWALRLIFRRFGVKCRTPVRRHPKETDRLRGLEEGSRGEIRRGSCTAVKTPGLEVTEVEMKETSPPSANTRSKTSSSL